MLISYTEFNFFTRNMCIIKNKSTKKIAKIINRTYALFHSSPLIYPDIPHYLDYHRVNSSRSAKIYIWRRIRNFIGKVIMIGSSETRMPAKIKFQVKLISGNMRARIDKFYSIIRINLFHREIPRFTGVLEIKSREIYGPWNYRRNIANSALNVNQNI